MHVYEICVSVCRIGCLVSCYFHKFTLLETSPLTASLFAGQTSLRELTTLGMKNAENLAIPSVRNDVSACNTVFYMYWPLQLVHFWVCLIWVLVSVFTKPRFSKFLFKPERKNFNKISKQLYTNYLDTTFPYNQFIFQKTIYGCCNINSAIIKWSHDVV